MACCGIDSNILCKTRKLSSEELQIRQRSKQIDAELKNERKKRQHQVRLLLLGAGESGKSTFLKQMRIINEVQFNEDDIKEYQKTIYMNIIKGLQVLIVGRKRLNIPFTDNELEEEGEKLLLFDSFSIIDSDNFADLYGLFAILWADKGLKETYKRRSEIQVIDSIGYFLDNLKRICKTDYSPSIQDILHARKTTQSIVEFQVEIDSIDFHFTDVGGQRAQRGKWYGLFSSELTSILFMASSSEFDQRLREDWNENRLNEAVFIFSTVVNNLFFAKIPCILFLNKMDLLKEKVTGERPSNIAEYFPSFNDASIVSKYVSSFAGDPTDINDVQMFILYLFLEKVKNVGPNSEKSGWKRQIYHHFTTATDTKNIRLVFNAVKDSILRRNLNSLMLE